MNQQTSKQRSFLVYTPFTITLIYLCISFVWLVVSEWVMLHHGASAFNMLLIRILYFATSGVVVFMLMREIQSLQNKGREYDQLLHTMREPIIIHRDGRIVELNQYAVEFFEAGTKDAMIGRSIFDIAHPDYKAIAKQRINQLYRGISTNTMEQQFVTLQGTVKDVEVNGVPVCYHGEPATQLMLRDITQRKHAEAELKLILERFRLIEENMTDAIAVMGADGIVHYQSPSYYTLLGRIPNLNRGEFDEDDVHPDDIDALKQAITTAIARHEKFQREFRIKHTLGHWIAVEMYGTPVLDEHGETTSVVLVSRDITDRAQTEEMLRQSDKLSAVGQLAAGIAHEIRNPLTAVKGLVQMLADSDTDQQRYFDIILDEVTRIELISNELLMLAKPQPVQLQPCHMHHIIDDVITLLKPQALMKNVAVHCELPSTTAIVRCDKHQIKQVFINIIKNAIEAVDHHGQLHVLTISSDDSMCVKVCDNGHGIAAEDLTYLGRPFYTTKDSGTGLGLMVSRKIIEHHGGSVVISSTINEGTTVTVMLPLQKAIPAS